MHVGGGCKVGVGTPTGGSFYIRGVGVGWLDFYRGVGGLDLVS